MWCDSGLSGEEVEVVPAQTAERLAEALRDILGLRMNSRHGPALPKMIARAALDEFRPVLLRRDRMLTTTRWPRWRQKPSLA
jgi:hypothetical protein